MISLMFIFVLIHDGDPDVIGFEIIIPLFLFILALLNWSLNIFILGKQLSHFSLASVFNYNALL